MIVVGLPGDATLAAASLLLTASTTATAIPTRATMTTAASAATKPTGISERATGSHRGAGGGGCHDVAGGRGDALPCERCPPVDPP